MWMIERPPIDMSLAETEGSTVAHLDDIECRCGTGVWILSRNEKSPGINFGKLLSSDT